MIFTNPNEDSAGKVVEIMPVIRDHFGSPYALPPVRYVVPNGLLGYEPHQVIQVVNQLPPTAPLLIGQGTRFPMEITFWVRLLEHLPEQDPQPAPFDIEAVRSFMTTVATCNGWCATHEDRCLLPAHTFKEAHQCFACATRRKETR